MRGDEGLHFLVECGHAIAVLWARARVREEVCEAKDSLHAICLACIISDIVCCGAVHSARTGRAASGSHLVASSSQHATSGVDLAGEASHLRTAARSNSSTKALLRLYLMSHVKNNIACQK